jgi:hypothetical protein
MTYHGPRAELRHKDLRGAASTTCPGLPEDAEITNFHHGT